MKSILWEFFVFGLKQARACVFAGSFLALLVASNYVDVGIPRYDFLFVGAVAIQLLLIWMKLETVDEAKTIVLFHLVGLGLELFKTHPLIGSWSYPEAGFLKVGTVPLYSGFMYAAVGSYVAQAWRVLELKFVDYPRYRFSVPLSMAIYANFFTHHWLPDFRWWLGALVLVVFWKTWVEFRVTEKVRRMPLVLGFFLIGFFIWVAENIATFWGAWKYPDQHEVWTLVSFSKVSSWTLLVIISVIIVADLKHFKEEREV